MPLMVQRLMPRGAKPKQYNPEIVRQTKTLYSLGHTQIEIADRLKLTQKIIWNVMRRHKIESRIPAKRNQYGENNGSWKGDGAGKQAFHKRLYARYGKPNKCSRCHTIDAKHYDYANLTGNYQDINDYAPMCRSCHWRYDKKYLNFLGRRKGGAKCQRTN